jgi:Transposase protein
MREHYGLDRLVEYGTEAVPDSVRVVNPAWRKLDSQVRALTGKRQRLLAQFAAQGLQGELSEAEVTGYQQKKAQLQEEIEYLGKQWEQIKQQRKETAHHVTVGELPEAERFSRLLQERKHFLDTIKLISYRAETNMASLLRESLSREDDTRALLRQIYRTEADLLPDADHKTLTVCLHHLTQAAHDQALLRLCDELNATETFFPGTDLRLIYKLGSC